MTPYTLSAAQQRLQDDTCQLRRTPEFAAVTRDRSLMVRPAAWSGSARGIVWRPDPEPYGHFILKDHSPSGGGEAYSARTFLATEAVFVQMAEFTRMGVETWVVLPASLLNHEAEALIRKGHQARCEAAVALPKPEPTDTPPPAPPRRPRLSERALALTEKLRGEARWDGEGMPAGTAE